MPLELGSGQFLEGTDARIETKPDSDDPRGMLVELSIRDLALIEAAELSFGPGLNTITGETGAGKSLLVGALELLVGARLRQRGASVVRAGAKVARVEGRFELVPGGERARIVGAYLAKELPDLHGDFAASAEDGGVHELILGRTVTQEGKSRAHLGQRPASLKALRSLASLLFEIHGQNDHQRLLLPEEQLALLDAFAGARGELEAYRECRLRWRTTRDALAAFEAERAERRDRLDLLRYQLGELTDARLEPGERQRLVAEREILRHAGQLATELGAVAENLSEGDGALIDVLRTMLRRIEAWRARVPGLDDVANNLREAMVFGEEAAAGLVTFNDSVEVDPARLEEVEERLAELERLTHKYQLDDTALIEHAAGLEDAVAELERVEGSSAELEAAVASAAHELAAAAKALTRKREAARKPLGKAVEAALAGLGLVRASFALAFRPYGAAPGPMGAETVEFQLAANPGELPAPLAAVASGGEAARIMLALRGVLVAGESGRCLVFDEIDAGVGGRLGPEVAGRLRELGEAHQVLCVTHLASIAAGAHRHHRVAKEVRGGRTLTVFAELEGEARVRELADMLAGGADEATARAEAGRLLAAY